MIGCASNAPLTVVVPFARSDYQLALDLFAWIRELGGCGERRCLLVAANHMSAEELRVAREAASQSFAVVDAIQPPHPLQNESWPRGANWLFVTAARHIESQRLGAWWWHEPDCIPLCPGWLAIMEEEYAACRKPFMGVWVRGITMKNRTVAPSFNGCAVYPENTHSLFRNVDLVNGEAWDIATGSITVPNGHNAASIGHFWGTEGNPPTFREFHSKGEPVNTLTLENVPRAAVVFHRVKDGSLLRLLREGRSELITGRRVTSFFHSGDLGDIIYGLFFAKRHSPVRLVLGPDSRAGTRQQMSPRAFEWLSALLLRQPWIESLEYASSPPSTDYNLNLFRTTYWSGRHRLFESYPKHFHEPALPEDEAWIEADPVRDSNRPVVISRTFRYQNPTFDWHSISKRYAGRMRFVGYREEYDKWVEQFGRTSEYLPVVDAREMANNIAGAELFIGNQSFPMSLALALNVPLIQEVFPRAPDCVFRRSNAQFIQQGPARLPGTQTGEKRTVVARPTHQGLYELGPCYEAYGLGDTLSIVPLARSLGNRAVMLMPSEMERYRFLFNGWCPVIVTNDFPVFRWDGRVNIFSSKLRDFGLLNADPVPVLNLAPEPVSKARVLLGAIRNPIAFCPTCARQWSGIRQRPPSFWKPVIAELSQRHTVIQFGWDDYPLVEGAQRIPFESMELLAALYYVCGGYVGVHTGDHHLAMAVGARVVCAEPGPTPEFNPEGWRYNSSRIAYADLNRADSVLAAIRKLDL